MKSLQAIVLMCFLAGSCAPSKSTLSIPSQSSIQIDYLNAELYEAEIKNKSRNDVEIKVDNTKTGESLRGFGLSGYGKANVLVEKEAALTLVNSSDKACRVSVRFDQKERSISENAKDGLIDFVLFNSSLKSIPLIIPGVMNPNLSPRSNSGVNLRIGQEIYFREKRRKYLLLRVDETISNGEKLDVPKLIKQRRIELGL